MSQRIAAGALLGLALAAPAAAQVTYIDQTVPQQPAVAAPVTPRPTMMPMPQETPPARPGQAGPTLESLGMRGFSVALVLGEMQGTSSADTLPAGAKRAINDMKDFLPYKSYRMLDASWTMCCAGRHGSVSGRLQGIEDTEYSFNVYIQGVTGSKMMVGFQLREVQASAEEAVLHTITRTERERELTESRRQLEAAEQELAALKRKDLGDNHPQVQAARVRRENARRRLDELESSVDRRRPVSVRSGTKQVMDSSFSMDVGETVVIGTSRLKGDKALIVLLTAASRTSSTTREP